MDILQIRHEWPEKDGFCINRPRGREDYTFLHFFNRVDLLINGVRQKTSPHACIFFSPGISQWFLSDGPLIHDWVHFSGAATHEILQSYGIQENVLYYPGNEKEITALFAEMEYEFFLGDSYSANMLEAKFQEFLIRFSRGCQMTYQSGIKDEERRVFAEIRQTMLLRLDEPWSVEKLAELACLSPSRFHGIYKSLFGISPIHDLIHARVSAAQNLLIAEQATVEELADRLGYTNPYHFIRQFKSITGRTPGQYRKEYKSMEAKKKPAFY